MTEKTTNRKNAVMNEKFDVQAYMSHGVETIVKDALRATLKNPRESAFTAKFAMSEKSSGGKHTGTTEN